MIIFLLNLTRLGLGGTGSAYFITPYRWVFYVLAGLFALLGFYFNVIRQRKPVNVTVYLLHMNTSCSIRHRMGHVSSPVQGKIVR